MAGTMLVPSAAWISTRLPSLSSASLRLISSWVTISRSSLLLTAPTASAALRIAS